MQLINIGFGNIVSANRIVAIVSPESAPKKRLIQEAKDNKKAVDATYGRRTRAVLIMDSGHVIYVRNINFSFLPKFIDAGTF